MDVQTHITNLDRLLSYKAKGENLPEAQYMGTACQCKHHWMRRLAAGIPVFVYVGSERWRVTLRAGRDGKQKPYWKRSFTAS